MFREIPILLLQNLSQKENNNLTELVMFLQQSRTSSPASYRLTRKTCTLFDTAGRAHNACLAILSPAIRQGDPEVLAQHLNA